MSAWRSAVLGQLVEAKAGFASGESVDEGVIQVRMNNVTTHGAFDWSRLRRVPHPRKGLNDFVAHPGDVLFNATNSPELVGKSAYFSGFKEPVTFSNHFLRLRGKGQIDGKYLAYWLGTRWKARTFEGMCRAWVNQASVSKDQLLALEIPLPPLDEQRRIAAILDQADALRRKRREAIIKLDGLRRSVFSESFVCPAGKDWPERTIADVADDIRTGPFGSQLLHSEFVESGVPVLGIDNAVSNEFRWSERRYITEEKYGQLIRYTVRPGDVLITIMGTCGRCAIVPHDIPAAINTKHLCCISLKRSVILPTFLHAAFLQHPDVLKQLGIQAKGAVMPGLNMGIIRSIKLRIPPLGLQKDFQNKLHAIDRIRAAAQNEQKRLDTLFASLQHRAFNGQLTTKLAERELAEVG